MADNDKNIERLIEYYRPRVRERADKLREAGGRISHHTVWFPLIDVYEAEDGEEPVDRETHKKAALQVFTEWCDETGVKPASVAGEFGHNFLSMVRGVSFLAMGGTAIGTIINLFKGQMAAVNLTITWLVVAIVVFLLSSWAHEKYFKRVFANTEDVEGGEALENKRF